MYVGMLSGWVFCFANFNLPPVVIIQKMGGNFKQKVSST